LIAGANGLFVSARAALGLETPAILEQPGAQTLPAGAQTVFRLLSVSSLPESYQWQFDGSNLDEATNDFLLLAAVSGDQGRSYQVVVTTAGG